MCIYTIYSVSGNTFSVGIDWKYNDSNKQRDNYVTPYHQDLKKEIMEYNYIGNNMKVYLSEIKPKAEAYNQTNLAKSVIAGLIEPQSLRWVTQTPIEHLICVILYTDYTELSSHFSESFRAVYKYEAIQSIRRRHQKYYWLSVGLKGLIGFCGQSYNNGKGLLSPLRGPFYCGISFVMYISKFNVRIFGPTSTSIHKEVATRFGGEDGLLIEFDNSKGSGRSVIGLDVSWLSRYAQEEER